MSLRAKVKAGVDTAFLACDDLVKIATLSNKSVSGYDFVTGATTSVSATESVEIILYTTSNSSSSTFTTTCIMKSGIVDLNVYDTLTVNSTDYRITDFTDDEFAIEATLVREK